MESFDQEVNNFLEVLNHQNANSGLDEDLLDLSHGMLHCRFDDKPDNDEDEEALEMTGNETAEFKIEKLSFFSNHRASR